WISGGKTAGRRDSLPPARTPAGGLGLPSAGALPLVRPPPSSVSRRALSLARLRARRCRVGAPPAHLRAGVVSGRRPPAGGCRPAAALREEGRRRGEVEVALLPGLANPEI
ncbi:unnamed protein product, partial [Urochloa humidicola]